MELYLNPLSANRQCNTVQDAEFLIKKLYEIIHFCRAMINAGNLVVFYDPHVECRELIQEQPFLQTIGNLSPDAKKLWVILKNNYAKFLAVNNEHESIDVCANTGIAGLVHSQLCSESKRWIGFLCLPDLDRELIISFHNNNLKIINCFEVDHLKSLVPIYELNPKHGRRQYVSAAGEDVSPMPKSDEEAQVLLFSSKRIPSNPDMWAYCKDAQEFYRFKRTHPNKEIYHGFLSPINEVPDEIKKLLK